MDAVWKEWAAAGLGCCLADTVFNPLEVLKTRRQIILSTQKAACTSSAGLVALASTHVRAEGLWKGLWEPGLLATWMRGMSYTGFRIGLYPTVRTALGRDDLIGRLLAGGVTGGVGALLFAPADVVRIRMQGPNPYGSTLGAFRTVASAEGVLALWRGVGASALRACLLSSTQLATYDTCKRVFKDKDLFAEGPGLHITASMLSGFAAQTVVMPADVLRTLVMSGARASDGGTLATLRALVREGGMRALYRGYLPALARQGPVMVVQMPLVEQLRRLFGLDYL